MKINEIFNIQRVLDTKILKEHHLEGRDLVDEKILALQVELGELANETRCFKYWSKKAPSAETVILEEYVDCLHFILSIGIEKQYIDVAREYSGELTNPTHQFLKVNSAVSNFYSEPSVDNYQNLWQSFLTLGQVLGFSWEEIIKAYMKKNEINHQRQADGY